MEDSSVSTQLAPEGSLNRLGLWASLRRGLHVAIICMLLIVLIPSDGYLGSAYISLAINQAIGSEGFRLGAWEVQAWTQKIETAVNRPGGDLSPQEQHDLVISYFDTIAAIDDLNNRIEAIFADPSQAAPKVAAAPLQVELDGLRAEQTKRGPAVERILQDQVTELLRENGLITAGMVFPPVLFHFSESPDVLIISPRDRIELERSAFVEPGAPVAQKERAEKAVEADLNVSALVEGTGGFSAYPTMVVAYSDLDWVLSTISHEWFHTYLVFHPLGWHYFDNSDTRTLNETAASIFGDELGAMVLAKYYPERVPPPAPAQKPADQTGQQTAQPKFRFSQTMRTTRLHVDELLAQGKVTEAESYMEAQRQIIVSHGYVLRKLNQAYFAFHGSYAVGPASTDPLGEKLHTLRERTHSLNQFVQKVSSITTVQDLDKMLAQMGS